MDTGKQGRKYRSPGSERDGKPRWMLVLLMAGVFVGGCSHSDVPAAALGAMEHAETYQVLSLDPNSYERPGPDNFHGWRVLGKVTIADRETQKKITDALRAGARENGGVAAHCFNPRHGIHVVRDNMSCDLVICFECMQAKVFQGDRASGGFLVTGSPRAVFDEVLRKAGVAVEGK